VISGRQAELAAIDDVLADVQLRRSPTLLFEGEAASARPRWSTTPRVGVTSAAAGRLLMVVAECLLALILLIATRGRLGSAP
jgi:hypothetical protein